MNPAIPARIVPSVQPSDLTEPQVAREFRLLLDAGAKIRPAGEARRDPLGLLRRGYTPKYKIELFDTTFYLTGARQNPDLRFFVVYVVQGQAESRRLEIFPRVFYKDVSLVWRSASHFARSDEENWIGKGDLKIVVEDGEEVLVSAEETTDLPLEIQTALETLNRRATRVPTDHIAVALLLRRAPDSRLEPYRDFSAPRRRAQANPENLVNGGKPVAGFTRPGDPSSLHFVPGFQPDFDHGVLEVDESVSKLYGGKLKRFRILSRNREIQYLFFAGPRHAWIIPAQATTTELSSFGVRTVDVIADDDLFIPGYEYHFMDESQSPPVLHSQIPKGFAGIASEHDETRADAAPWLDRLPVIQEFREKVLGRKPRLRAAKGAGAPVRTPC